MAKFLALIYEAEEPYASGDQAVFDKVMAAHSEFSAKHGPALGGGDALQPAASARTIRTDESGAATVTDGPFLETKEVLGGYYVIEADDLDEALTMAKDVPVLTGGVEVRPIMVFN